MALRGKRWDSRKRNNTTETWAVQVREAEKIQVEMVQVQEAETGKETGSANTGGINTGAQGKYQWRKGEEE